MAAHSRRSRSQRHQVHDPQASQRFRTGRPFSQSLTNPWGNGAAQEELSEQVQEANGSDVVAERVEEAPSQVAAEAEVPSSDEHTVAKQTPAADAGDGTWTEAPSKQDVVAGNGVVSLGAQGPIVSEVQQTLTQMGFGIAQTGKLGPTTSQVIKDFQAAYGVETTGIIGPTTLEMLNRASQASVSFQDLRQIVPQLDPSRAKAMLQYINASMYMADISSDARKAAYLAQLAHETDGFNTLEEYASGADYEGRRDLGNTQSGDGRRYKGRGAIQLTGRANYARVDQILGTDLIENPELAATNEYGFKIAAVYWKDHELNELADRGDFEGITDVINYYDPERLRQKRRSYHARARATL